MLFGFEIQPQMIMTGGAALGVLILFQILQGLRVITLKGRLHRTVHKAVAFVILASGLFHGVAGLAYFGYL